MAAHRTFLLVLVCAASLGGCAAGEYAEDATGYLQDSEDRKSDAVGPTDWRWPEGDIYALMNPSDPEWLAYWGSPDTARSASASYLKIAQELEANTPIRVHYITEESQSESGYFVRILGTSWEGTGGSATIGTLAGDSELFIRSTPSGVAHELGHVAGLRHTHSRRDRDEHVTIHWENVAEKWIRNFKKHQWFDIGPYDFDSIMHYESFAFAKDYGCATITPADHGGDHCSVQAVSSIQKSSSYSEWNYVVLSAMYCEPRYCGEYCASKDRCSTPAVVKNLERLRHFENTGKTDLPRQGPPRCGDGYVDEELGEECDDEGLSSSCDSNCTLAFCGDGDVNPARGEECDDGPGSAECRADCTATIK